MEKADKSLFDKALDCWWGKVIIAFAIFAGTYWTYTKFTELETGDRDLVRGSRLVISTYKLFGKWPVVAAEGLLGVGVLGLGIKQFATGKE